MEKFGHSFVAQSRVHFVVEQVLDHLCEKAGIKPGETTADGNITIEPAECLGACDFAPCMLAGNDLHKDLTPEKADAFLESVGRQNG